MPVSGGLPDRLAFAPGWKTAAIRLGIVAALLIATFASDWAAMARQWWDSSTYNHVLLVPPIVAWLVWLRLPQLARIAPACWWPPLIGFAAALLLWVMGSFAGLSLASQAGALGMLLAAVVGLIGPKASAALAFPLGYSLFLVPFGDELVPLLQMITAHITVALVHVSAIPAAIDGVFIDTPAGLFEVAEACSGVKFLIAMIAFGVLVANVCFVSWRRRIAFLAACVIMPILANGVRAWGTIYVAQFKGAAYAGGFDHIVYGWIFFAIVIALTMALGWRFFDRPSDDAMIDAEAIAASPSLDRLEALRLNPRAALGVIAGLVLLGQGWALAADRLSAPLPEQVFLPEVPGWQRVDYHPRVAWEPRASGADHRLIGRYADGQGRTVDVFYALYASQVEGKEAGGFGEGALTPDSGWSWQEQGPAPAQGKSERLLSARRTPRLAETYYRTGTLLTGSNMRLKLAVIADRLLLRERPTTLLILSSEDAGQQRAEDSLAAFRNSAGPIDAWVDRIGAIR